MSLTLVNRPPAISSPWYSANFRTLLFGFPSVSHTAPLSWRIAYRCGQQTFVATSKWSFPTPNASTNPVRPGSASNLVPSHVTRFGARTDPAIPEQGSTSFPCHSTSNGLEPAERLAGVTNPSHAASSGRLVVTNGASDGAIERGARCPGKRAAWLSQSGRRSWLAASSVGGPV